MDERTTQIFDRHLAGETARAIAEDLGISRARVYQLIQQARESGEFYAAFQATVVSPNINREHLIAAHARFMASYGIVPRRPQEQ